MFGLVVDWLSPLTVRIGVTEVEPSGFNWKRAKVLVKVPLPGELVQGSVCVALNKLMGKKTVVRVDC